MDRPAADVAAFTSMALARRDVKLDPAQGERDYLLCCLSDRRGGLGRDWRDGRAAAGGAVIQPARRDWPVCLPLCVFLHDAGAIASRGVEPGRVDGPETQ